MRIIITIIFPLFIDTVLGQFDFGGDGGGSCEGSGSFQQDIAQGAREIVGEIPIGLEGLSIQLRSDVDVDIQLTSGTTEVINWDGGIIAGATSQIATFGGDSIAYSGYNGDGNGPGNEYVNFSDATSNRYTMYAYGYAAGLATVTYSWTGRVGCTEGSPDPAGFGSFNQSISQNQEVEVGSLPAGLTDVYVLLDSPGDIDLVLYEGSTPIIAKDVERNPASFDHGEVEIQYSGFLGERRSGTYGKEYLFIKGTLDKMLTLKVFGYGSGTAIVEYSWGYYRGTAGKFGMSLKTALHDIIDGHTELSYTPGCWDALKRADQDPDNTDNVILLYSGRSEPKANQDNGRNGQDAWNREHVWAKSHGNFGTSRGAGTDIHALRAADKSVNTERSAKDFAEGGTQLTSSEPREDCPLCNETDDSFEPPDEVKGDVARMLFYMATRYNGDSDSNNLTLTVVGGTGTPSGSSTTGNGELGDLGVLKAWHNQDPPSNEEKHRNNIVFDIQGNRNPFIDYPEWVNSIF